MPLAATPEFRRGEIDQAFPDRGGGSLGRHAVEIRAGGGSGRRGVRHLVGGGGGDPHAVERNAELLRHHLRDLHIEPLPHLGAAVIELHRAIGVDMNQGAGLVQVGEREGDAEFDRRQRQALLQISGCAY